MNKKLSIIFVFILASLFGMNIVAKDQDLSYSERRKLEQMPEWSKEGILSGDYMEGFEDYALDQFVFRDSFKSVKSYMELYGFWKNDVNGIYVYDDYLIKRVEKYNPDSTVKFTEYIKDMANRFSDNSNIYYMIIPDKNYYVADESYQTIDYKEVFDTIDEELSGFTLINAKNLLTLDDYYKTDTHWRQEMLGSLLAEIDELMNLDIDFDITEYEANEYEEFYGVYAGQSGLGVVSEKLIYLSKDLMDSVVVTNYESLEQEHSVYELEMLEGMDSYDVFLGGAAALITIENNEEDNDKELIIFRDSFGSSIAPLLIEGYAKITLVDTRYMSSAILDQYIEFGDQDVLFMYNTEVVNSSQMLR